ncbi:hypothetical protein [Paenibacillus wulumuqiensis]|uniref:hypothetical protein n=1 Tax=Paenibacillus wulumuqiensis TaxID=1567107 RepID=UPI000619C030|nr:hypothetical protein [Paenibacillus wulumuqiensis]
MNKAVRALIIINILILVVSAYIYVLNRQQAKEIGNLSKQLDKANVLFEDVKILKANEAFQRLAHTVEGAYTTEDFIVERINFYTNKDNTKLIGVTLNLTPQSKMALLYKDAGQFAISDREFRAKLEPFIPEIKKYYGVFSDTLPWGNNVNATITVRNYEVATYKDGKLILTGE